MYFVLKYFILFGKTYFTMKQNLAGNEKAQTPPTTRFCFQIYD